MTRARVNFALFTLGVLGAGWLGVAVDRAAGTPLAGDVAFSTGGGTTGMALFILGPALVALALYFFSRDGAGPLGLTPRADPRWYAAAVAFYPFVTVIAIGLGLAAGAASLTLDPAYPAAFAAVFAIQLIKNPIEEFIFRGYGTRTAMALGLPGAATPHLLVGVVWALWHLPLYLVWTSAADMRLMASVPLPVFLPLLLLGLTAAGLVYGELRVRTGSIWPGVLLHSMANAIVTPLVVNRDLTFAGHSDVLFSPVATSVVTTLLFATAGIWLLRRRRPAFAPAASRIS